MSFQLAERILTLSLTFNVNLPYDDKMNVIGTFERMQALQLINPVRINIDLLALVSTFNPPGWGHLRHRGLYSFIPSRGVGLGGVK